MLQLKRANGIILSWWIASIAPIAIRCIDYLAYGTIFMREMMFRPKIKLGVFFSPEKPEMSPGEWCPPPPQPPVAAETLAILVVGVNYILPLKQRALLPPDAKRTARMCCCLDRIKHHHLLHRIAQLAIKIAAMRSRSVKHLPRQNFQVKELYSMNWLP